MDKEAFLQKLRQGLAGLPEEDIAERLLFYSEMIDDRKEDGITEQQAVDEIGSAEDVIAQIMSEIPLPRLVMERVKPKRTLRIWEIVLLVLGFPVWLPLLLSLAAVVLSAYVVIWAAALSLWAVDLSAAGFSVSLVVYAAVFIAKSSFLQGLAFFGAGLAFAGAAILLFIGCGYATKGLFVLTKEIIIKIKLSFVKRVK